MKFASRGVCICEKNGIVGIGLFNGKVCIWDIQKKGIIVTFTGHSVEVKSVQFFLSKSSLFLFSASKEIRVHDVMNKRLVAKIPGHPSRITAMIVFSLARVVSASDDGIKVWSVSQNCREECRLVGHSGLITVLLKLDESGDFFASGSEDNVIRIWSLKTSETINFLKGHTSAVTDLRIVDVPFSSSFSDGSSKIASSGRDRTIRIWRIDNLEKPHCEVVCLQICENIFNNLS